MSKIIITDDFEKAAEEIRPDETFSVNELKVEDVAKIRDFVYIASRNKKTVLIAAEKYSSVSQNALLKLLEEPPKNIEFVLLAKSKYALLDTIKSRLVIEKRIYNTVSESDIDISTVSNDRILEILKSDLDVSEIKALIYKITKEKNLNEEQMAVLCNSIKMLELNIDKQAVISLIMLSIKEKH